MILYQRISESHGAQASRAGFDLKDNEKSFQASIRHPFLSDTEKRGMSI